MGGRTKGGAPELYGNDSHRSSAQFINVNGNAQSALFPVRFIVLFDCDPALMIRLLAPCPNDSIGWAEFGFANK